MVIVFILVAMLLKILLLPSLALLLNHFSVYGTTIANQSIQL